MALVQEKNGKLRSLAKESEIKWQTLKTLGCKIEGIRDVKVKKIKKEKES